MRYPKSKLPHKIWGGCINRPTFPDCGEVSVAIDLGGVKSKVE